MTALFDINFFFQNIEYEHDNEGDRPSKTEPFNRCVASSRI